MIKVQLREGIRPPDRIFIISPSYVFDSDQFARSYMLKVSNDQDFGPMIVVVMAAWMIRFLMRKIRPEYPSEEGLQPWEDPDLMDWEEEE